MVPLKIMLRRERGWSQKVKEFRRELSSTLGCDSEQGSEFGAVAYAVTFTPGDLTGVTQLLVILAIS